MSSGVDESSLWAIHNQLRGWTVSGLTLNEARIIVKTLTHSDQLETLVYNSELKKWSSLKNVKFLKELPALGQMQLPPLPSETGVNMIPDALAETQIKVGAKATVKAPYKRSSERHDIKINVRINFDSIKIKTYTVNVSLGGFMLKDPIPDDVMGHFLVHLELLEGKFLGILCNAADGQEFDRKRLVIADHNPEKVIQVYQVWLQQKVGSI